MVNARVEYGKNGVLKTHKTRQPNNRSRQEQMQVVQMQAARGLRMEVEQM